MNQRFPIHIHRRDENGATTFLATTALVKLADAPDQLQAQLRDFADAYVRVVAEARAALDDARGERQRAYWRVGKAIYDFEATLGGAGFYLAGQTATFARDLGLNAGTLRKILAFYRRNADVSALRADSPWRRSR
ncbi:MAG: hypothetical protein AB1817_16430 [Chloroflexota bacterium]